jgi:hypothetical protein
LIHLEKKKKFVQQYNVKKSKNKPEQKKKAREHMGEIRLFINSFSNESAFSEKRSNGTQQNLNANNSNPLDIDLLFVLSRIDCVRIELKDVGLLDQEFPLFPFLFFFNGNPNPTTAKPQRQQ